LFSCLGLASVEPDPLCVFSAIDALFCPFPFVPLFEGMDVLFFAASSNPTFPLCYLLRSPITFFFDHVQDFPPFCHECFFNPPIRRTTLSPRVRTLVYQGDKVLPFLFLLFSMRCGQFPPPPTPFWPVFSLDFLDCCLLVLLCPFFLQFPPFGAAKPGAAVVWGFALTDLDPFFFFVLAATSPISPFPF